jgi:hypothetical protein
MNEEILINIWNTLTSDSTLKIKAANFEEWKTSFIEDKNIQTNVYDYLKGNHNVKSANQEEWTNYLMGKTSGSPTSQSAEPSDTDLSSENTSSELPSNDIYDGLFKKTRTVEEELYVDPKNLGKVMPYVAPKMVEEEYYVDANGEEVNMEQRRFQQSISVNQSPVEYKGEIRSDLNKLEQQDYANTKREVAKEALSDFVNPHQIAAKDWAFENRYKEKEVAYKGAEANPYVVGAYDEIDFKNWLETVMGGGTGQEDVGFGDASLVKLPGEQTFTIDLQSFTTSGREEVAQQVMKIQKASMDRAKNPDKYAVYYDFKPFGDLTLEYKAKEVKNFNELRKRYANVGLDISQTTKKGGGSRSKYYIVKKNGEVIFEGKGARENKFDEKESLGDFMFNYNFTNDEYADINVGRQYSKLKLESDPEIAARLSNVMYGDEFIANVANNFNFEGIETGGVTSLTTLDLDPDDPKQHNLQFEEGFGEFMEMRDPDAYFGLSDSEWFEKFGFKRTNQIHSVNGDSVYKNKQGIYKDFILYMEAMTEPRAEGEDVSVYNEKMKKRHFNIFTPPFGGAVEGEYDIDLEKASNEEMAEFFEKATWHKPSAEVLQQLESFLTGAESNPLALSSISSKVANIKAENLSVLLKGNAKYQNLLGASNEMQDAQLQKEVTYTNESFVALVNSERENKTTLSSQLDKHVLAARKAGVTDVDYNKTTGLYKVTAENKEVAKMYSEIFNDWGSQVTLFEEAYAKEYVEINNTFKSFQSRADEIGAKTPILEINYDKGDQVLAATQVSFKKLALSLPALLGNDAAKDAWNQEDIEYNTNFTSKGRYSDVEGWREALTYAGLTMSENSAVTVMALATAGVGGAYGVGFGAVSSAIGVQAAISQGGETRIRIENTEDDIVEWKEMKADLYSNKDEIPVEQFNAGMLKLNNLILENEIEPWQKTSKILTTVIVEFLVTKFIGATNYTMTAGAITTPTKELLKNITRGNWRAGAHVVGQTMKGIAREGLEEETIYLGNATADWSILDKDFDMSDWDVVLVDAAIISGPMVGTGSFYQTVMTQMATAPIKAQIKALGNEDQRIQAKMKELNILYYDGDIKKSGYELALKGLNAERITNFKGYGIAQNEMEGMAMSLDPKALNNIIASSKALQDLSLEAGVDPTISLDLQATMIRDYANKLKPKAAKIFKGQWDAAIKLKNNAFKGQQNWAQTTERVYGDQGKVILDRLIENNPELKKASDKEQFIAIHQEYKNELRETQIGNAKSNNSAVEFVEKTIYGEGGFEASKKKQPRKKKKQYKRNTQLEEQYYEAIGSKVQMNTTSGIIILGKDTKAASSIISDDRLKSLDIEQATGGKKGLKKAVDKAYAEEQEKEINNINATKASKADKKSAVQKVKAKYKANSIQIQDALASGKTNAIIVGGKYIVQDAKAANTAVANGNWLAGTAIFHEIGHGVDALAFDVAGKTDYAKKLSEYMAKNHPDIHHDALANQAVIGNYKINPNTGVVSYPNWSKEKGQTQEDGENTFWDEYSMRVQDAFRLDKEGGGKESAKLAKLSSGIGNSYRSLMDGDFKVNSSKDAAIYLSSYLEGFAKNELGKLQKRRIDNPGKEKRGDSGTKLSKDQTNSVNELAEMGWTNSSWKTQGADFAIKEMQSNKMLDGLIRSKYKADIVPDNFVDLVYSELVSHVKNFKPEQNDNLFGWINSQIANKAGNVYNREFKVADEMKGAKDIGKTTKEGEVKVQVAAETDSRIEALETEDLSPAAQAKKKADKAKGKEKVESKFRREIGIKTGSDLYNKVLDTARKSLLRAYEAGSTVRDIQRKLRDEANVYMFKDVKNFLGTTKYIKNLKEFRVPIMNSIFTADLVQMERNMAEGDRVFTKFVEKLTSKADVQKAVDQNLLPASALNIIDKGTAVSLYQKANPTEAQFMSYFDIPTINPKTGARSGTRGTRKDQLAKNIAGALSYDATMEVAQEPDVIMKREQLAALKGETLAQDDLEVLAATIGRGMDVKFSTNKKANENRVVSNMSLEIVELLDAMVTNPTLVVKTKDGSYKLNSVDIIKRWTKGSKFAKSDEAIIAEFAYKTYRSNEYGKLTDVNLQKKVLRNVIKARKNKFDLSTHQAFEQLVISSLQYAAVYANREANNKIKTNKKVKEGVGEGDAYISSGRIQMGVEVKMNEADAVSQTVNIKEDGSASFTNPNPTTNENGVTYDSLMGDMIIKATEALSKELGGITNSKLDNTQMEIVANNVLKTKYLQTMDISVEYAMWHYGNGKYKNKPQGFIHVGAATYRMVTGNSKIDGVSLAIAQEFKRKTGVEIPTFSVKLVRDENGRMPKDKGYIKTEEQSMQMVARLKIERSTGKLNWRISPRIVDNQLVSSNVNLLNKVDAINFMKAASVAMPKLSKSQDFQTVGKATKESRSANNPTQGITVLDFDDSLATSKSLIRFTKPDGTKGTLNAEQYASTYESLSELGYKFDFSEFTKVVDGKTAPLFNKAMKLQGKFGPENMFVLTARPAESAVAIHAFLKANGLNIPLKNITGLANSTAEAKALWMAEKVSEGYNDFYFADDALQNVKAVKNMLNQFDVKSKVQQARVKFSQSMDPAFNMMLERNTGIPAEEIISQVRAKKRGAKKGRFALFVPPSAEDFLGLLYSFAGRGKQGDADLAFLKKSLIDPLNRAYTELDSTKQAIADDYKNLKKQNRDVVTLLTKKTPDTDFTYADAARVYLWNKSGFEIPGLSIEDQTALAELVVNDPELQAYADKLGLITRLDEGYTKPGEHWQAGDIRNDLSDATNKISRKQFFTEFTENANVIFSTENLQKIESIYGSNFREALEDILYRTKTGVNKSKGSGRLEGTFTNWVNGSVAATMFVNVRSALLQNLSNVNFINWGDNNPLKAGKAFANQKQYWKDFAMIFNSAKLKQRRSGLGMDINANELTAYMSKQKSSPKALLNWLLQKGFLPTQMADSFAISTGGAAFYRNRVNTYLKQGMKLKNAEEQAWNDFSEISEATQQSARPDMVSQQQASALGKFLLNFQNTPMQYTRLIKKATIDLAKGRGDFKTNVSRIIYYGAIQNAIFYGLQTALFAMMFGDDEEEELVRDKNGVMPKGKGYIKTTKTEKFFDKKKERVANGMVDSILRGTGISGAVIATAKNMIIKFLEQKEKGYNKDESAVLLQFLNFSPVIGIKSQKIVSAQKGYNYNEKVIDHMSTMDIDNPVWGSVSSVVEGTTNVPLNRLYKKVTNVRAAMDAENQAWQRLSVLLGFSTWDVGIENKEIEAIKAELKELNKIKKEKETKTKKKKKVKSKRTTIEQRRRKSNSKNTRSRTR